MLRLILIINIRRMKWRRRIKIKKLQNNGCIDKEEVEEEYKTDDELIDHKIETTHHLQYVLREK